MLYTGVWNDIEYFKSTFEIKDWILKKKLTTFFFIRLITFSSLIFFSYLNYRIMPKVIFSDIFVLFSDESSVKNLKLPAGYELSSREVDISVQVIDYLGEMQEWTKTVTASFLLSFMLTLICNTISQNNFSH